MSKIYLKGIAVKSETGYRVLASTDAVDRQGDIVEQSGWELKNFLLNPVILWAHKYDELPVGKATGVTVTKSGLELDFEFASAEGNPKAQQVANLFENGFLNAVSVGFIPKERNGNTITKAELLEVSIVPVPANQEALRLAMSKGLDIKDLQSDIEKGEVQDVLTAQEILETKYENMDSVMEVIYAFYNAYFNTEVKPEEFNKMLGETIGLLQKISDGEVVEGEPVEASVKEKFLNFAERKEGRVLSDKNRKLIGDCIGSMKGSISVLEELHNATASSKEGDGDTAVVETPAPVVEDPNIVKVSKGDLAMFRTMLRANDRQTEVALTLVGKFLSAKE